MPEVTLHIGNQHGSVYGTGSEPTITIRRLQISVTEERRDVLSVTEFAAEARITPQAVRKMIAEARLRAHKVGEQHVISRDELNRYLSDR